MTNTVAESMGRKEMFKYVTNRRKSYKEVMEGEPYPLEAEVGC